MPDTRHLRTKTVILKMAGANRAVSTEVVNEEEDGLWFSGGELIGELREAFRTIPQTMKNPAVFVPFSQIQFLTVDGE